MTNMEFSKKSETFKAACEAAGIPATKRQASKFRLGKGLAFKNKPTETKVEGGE